MFVYDGNLTGNENRLRAWKDGIEVVSAAGAGTIPATLPATTNLTSLCFSARNGAVGTAISHGRIRLENVMVWVGTALTVGEAMAQYHLPVPVTTDNLRIWMPLLGSGGDLAANLVQPGQPGVGPTFGTVTGALPSFGPGRTYAGD